jgi:glutamate racemase
MNKLNIGFFDSGIGGLSILKECFSLPIPVRFHYIADHSYHPYGEKGSHELIERCVVLTEQLKARGCQHIVIACNTATAIAIEVLRDKYQELTFIGVEPYLNVLSKDSISEDDCLGVLVTRATLESERFSKLKKRLDPNHRLQAYALDDLAPFIEEHLANKYDDVVFEKKLKNILTPIFTYKWTHIILGCTHYPLIGSSIAKLTGATVVDPAHAVAARLLSLLPHVTQHHASQKVEDSFYYATTGEDAVEVASHWKEQTLADFY